MSVLFDFLNRYLLEDELMKSWNKFEDFEKYVRKQGQNIREYAADFYLKFREIENNTHKTTTWDFGIQTAQKCKL